MATNEKKKKGVIDLKNLAVKKKNMVKKTWRFFRFWFFDFFWFFWFFI